MTTIATTTASFSAKRAPRTVRTDPAAMAAWDAEHGMRTTTTTTYTGTLTALATASERRDAGEATDMDLITLDGGETFETIAGSVHYAIAAGAVGKPVQHLSTIIGCTISVHVADNSPTPSISA